MYIIQDKYTGNGSGVNHVIRSDLSFRPIGLVVQGVNTETGNLTIQVGGVSHSHALDIAGSHWDVAAEGTFTLDAAGFTNTSGASNALNVAGQPYYYILFGDDGSNDIGAFLFTGNGAATRNVGALGFTPDLAWQMGNNASSINLTLDRENTGTNCGVFGNLVEGVYGMQGFAAGGVTVNNQPDGNQNLTPYAVICFKNHAKELAQFSFAGNGVNGHTVAHGLGTTPVCAFVHERTNVGQNAVVKFGQEAATASVQVVNGTELTTQITGMDGTNLTLGTSALTNANLKTYTAWVFGPVAAQTVRLRTLVGTGV